MNLHALATFNLRELKENIVIIPSYNCVHNIMSHRKAVLTSVANLCRNIRAYVDMGPHLKVMFSE